MTRTEHLPCALRMACWFHRPIAGLEAAAKSLVNTSLLSAAKQHRKSANT